MGPTIEERPPSLTPVKVSDWCERRIKLLMAVIVVLIIIALILRWQAHGGLKIIKGAAVSILAFWLFMNLFYSFTGGNGAWYQLVYGCNGREVDRLKQAKKPKTA